MAKDFISDEEMQGIERSGKTKTAPDFISDEEMDSSQQPGLLKQAGSGLLHGIEKVGKAIDSYTGAPIRSAIGAAQDGKSPFSEYATAFGRDPSQAPTGFDIAKKAGFSTEKPKTTYGGKFHHPGGNSPADVAGTVVDFGADPSLLVGGASKLARPIAGAARAMSSKVGAIAESAGNISSRVGTKVSTKVGNLISGVPEKEIETYIKSYPEVQKMIREYGDNIPEAADKIREGFQSSIRAKRAELSKSIDTALSSLPDDKVLDSGKILSALESQKSKLLKSKQVEEAGEIGRHIEKIKSFGMEMDPIYGVPQYTGQITPKELNSIKGYLQDVASGAYIKDGQIFTHGRASQGAAKTAAREARMLLDTVSPAVARSNQELSKLHIVEGRLNKNLIAPGKPEAALLAAGSGANQRNVKNLQRLEEITGAPVLKDAEKLAAAKRFSNPGFSAADSTGKAAERMLKAGLIGGVAGGPVAGGVAALATSPAALKMAIQAGRIPVEAVKTLAGSAGSLTAEGIEKAYQVINTPQGAQALEALVNGTRALSIERGGGLLKTAEADQNRKPAKGKK